MTKAEVYAHRLVYGLEGVSFAATLAVILTCVGVLGS